MDETDKTKPQRGHFSHYILYTASSLMASVVDLTAFQLLLLALPAFTLRIAVATYTARVISCTFDFFLKKFMVFSARRSAGKSMAKYYFLCVCQVSLSALLVSLSEVLPGPAVVKKMVVDTTLFFLSYLVQRFWVFDGIKQKHS